MLKKIESVLKEVREDSPKTAEELEKFRINHLGKNGTMNRFFEEFKQTPNTEKKELGQALNKLKKAIQEKLKEKKYSFSENFRQPSNIDLSKPVVENTGSRHPLKLIRNEIIDIFRRIGFSLSEGPEIEDDWHNFTALNLPEEHPARDMQDTFFIQQNPDILLRTHTSSVQVRYMQKSQPPIRILSPGRVYRNEAISSRSHCIFHQIEGLYIDNGVSFADLKQTILFFAKEMFGSNTKIRLRPSYFPFTEPSAEVDVYWGLNSEKDYRITKGTGWLEIMGCGMVDSSVLKNSNIDDKSYTGFAFGMGIERITMLKYQVDDIRYFFENDVRFLKQFKSVI